MADFPKFQRPVNEACSKKKIVCPEASCQKENLFFEENGLGHHFRTIHRKEVNAKVVSKAVVKTRELYGQETLEYIAALSEWKSKVSICIIHVLHFKWNSNVMQIASTGFPRGLERFAYKVLNPNFSHCRSPKVNIDVGCEGTNQRIFSEDPEEAAKLFGMYLRCGGRLKCYAEESKPCKIEVRSTELEVHFNAWFETRPIDECTHGTVIIL